MDRLLSRAGGAGIALVAWTLLTWTTRVPLLWTDDSVGVGGKLLSTVPVLVFVGLAVASVVGLLRGSDTPLRLLAGWSVAYWIVRLPLIALGGHPVGFVVVHTVLAVVAGALGVAVLLRGRERSLVEVSGP